MGKIMPSGTDQRNQATADAMRQKAELDKQKQIAEDQQASALQDILARDTRLLNRAYGTRSLISGRTA